MRPSTPPTVLETATIRVDQAPKQVTGPAHDEFGLPVGKDDLPIVFFPRSMLREETGPRLRIRIDLDAVRLCRAVVWNARGQDTVHCRLALAGNFRIPPVKRDSELEDSPGMNRDAPITEIQTEKIDIGRAQLLELMGLAAAQRTSTGLRKSKGAGQFASDPVADGRSRLQGAVRLRNRPCLPRPCGGQRPLFFSPPPLVGVGGVNPTPPRDRGSLGARGSPFIPTRPGPPMYPLGPPPVPGLFGFGFFFGVGGWGRWGFLPVGWCGPLAPPPQEAPPAPLSSRGLGRRILSPETRVRIPVAVPFLPANPQVVGSPDSEFIPN